MWWCGCCSFHCHTKVQKGVILWVEWACWVSSSTLAGFLSHNRSQIVHAASRHLRARCFFSEALTEYLLWTAVPLTAHVCSNYGQQIGLVGFTRAHLPSRSGVAVRCKCFLVREHLFLSLSLNVRSLEIDVGTQEAISTNAAAESVFSKAEHRKLQISEEPSTPPSSQSESCLSIWRSLQLIENRLRLLLPAATEGK